MPREGMCVLDASGRLHDANDSLAELLQAARADLVGKCLLDLLPSAGERVRAMMAALGSGATRSVDVTLGGTGAAARDVRVTLARLSGDSFCATFRDLPISPADLASVKDSEAKFSAAFQGSVDPMGIVRTEDGLILDVNLAFEQLFGYTREDAIGRRVPELGLSVDPRFRQRVVEALRSGGRMRDEPWTLRTKSGEVREALHSAFLISREGEMRHVAVIRDVTEQRARERELRESEAKFSAAFHASVEAMVISMLDDGRIVDVNEAYVRLTGYSREELIGRTTLEMGIVADPEGRASRANMMRAEGAVRDVPSPTRRRDGEIRECLQTSFGIEIRGEPGWVSVRRDVTDIRRAERALRQSEARFHAVFRGSPDPIVISRMDDGVVVDVNPAHEVLTGYSREEIVGRSVIDLDIVDLPKRAALVDEVRRHGFVKEWDFTNRHRSGEVRLCRQSSFHLDIGDDDCMVSIVRDVTDLRRIEAAVRTSEERLRQAVRASAIGIFDHDHVADTLYWSPEQRAIFGFTPEEPVSLAGFLSCVHPDDLETIGAAVRQAHDPSKDGFFDVEHRIIRRDGEERWLFTRSQTFFEGAGDGRHPVRTVGGLLDVTEKKRVDEELRQLNEALEIRVAERTAELERANRDLESFSYSISHDLRAPLRHVVGYIDMFERDLAVPLDDTTKRRLDVISDAARRMGTMIDSLLAFARIGRAAMQFSAVDVNAVVGDVRMELRPDTDNRQIEWEVAELPTVTADRTLLKMVFSNLVSNAIKFTAERAPARIGVGAHRADSGWVFFVSDNGAGFDMRYADKLFGVFQRLHSADEFPGTGIGLANCRRIVERHGGRIWAESEPGAGTRILFLVPDLPQRAG